MSPMARTATPGVFTTRQMCDDIRGLVNEFAKTSNLSTNELAALEKDGFHILTVVLEAAASFLVRVAISNNIPEERIHEAIGKLYPINKVAVEQNLSFEEQQALLVEKNGGAN